MSIEAVKWALKDAPNVPPHLVATLIGLANHAGEDGRGAYPSVSTLAAYTRKNGRSVKRDLRELEALGLIRRGNQQFVAWVPPARRPTVYDLALGRTHSTEEFNDVSEDHHSLRGDVDVTPDRSGDDVDVTSGVTSTSVRGDVDVTRTVLNQKPPPPTRADAREHGTARAREAEEAAEISKSKPASVAAAFVADLPGPLTHMQSVNLAALAAPLLSAGWPPAELHRELAADIGSARSKFTVYAHRVRLLADAPVAAPRQATAPTRPQHRFAPGSDGIACTTCGTPERNASHSPAEVTA